jgi:hypothetical protein
MSVLAMQAHVTVMSERETHFDTDSANIGIDNRCSACISHVESDFEGLLCTATESWKVSEALERKRSRWGH